MGTNYCTKLNSVILVDAVANFCYVASMYGMAVCVPMRLLVACLVGVKLNLPPNVVICLPPPFFCNLF